jgi:hypothetical protein
MSISQWGIFDLDEAHSLFPTLSLWAICRRWEMFKVEIDRLSWGFN